jgi:hypothetical protein
VVSDAEAPSRHRAILDRPLSEEAAPGFGTRDPRRTGLSELASQALSPDAALRAQLVDTRYTRYLSFGCGTHPPFTHVHTISAVGLG